MFSSKGISKLLWLPRISENNTDGRLFIVLKNIPMYSELLNVQSYQRFVGLSSETDHSDGLCPLVRGHRRRRWFELRRCFLSFDNRVVGLEKGLQVRTPQQSHELASVLVPGGAENVANLVNDVTNGRAYRFHVHRRILQTLLHLEKN